MKKSTKIEIKDIKEEKLKKTYKDQNQIKSTKYQKNPKQKIKIQGPKILNKISKAQTI